MQIKNSLNTILLLAIAALLLWNRPATQPAVIAAPSPQEQTAAYSISVSGSSAIRVQPDRVVVLFGIHTFVPVNEYVPTPNAYVPEVQAQLVGTLPARARAQNERRTRAVIEALRGLGIADRDIATANFQIHPRYTDYDRNLISGYAADSTVAVTLRDVRKLQTVLVAALEAGATTVDGIEFSVTNMRALRDQARVQAVQAALEKAEAMAKAAGMKLGHVISISEVSHSWGRQWTSTQNMVYELPAEGTIVLEDGSISLGQIVVTAEVNLTVEMKAP